LEKGVVEMVSVPLLVSFSTSEESLKIIAKELNFNESEIKIAESLTGKGFPPLVKSAVLPYLFGISHRLIGLMEMSPERFYRTFSIEKSGGGTREIKAPRVFLKIIQRWIYEHICLREALDDCVTGFVRGKNIFDNGLVHSKNRNLMVIDIKNFFPSITFNQVKIVFIGLGFPERVAYQLTALCCLGGQLPQGAPTSPVLANMVFKPTDSDLLALSKEWGCSYTRYADDLAFSGSKVFTNEDKAKVGAILEGAGFLINESKSRIIGPGGRQILAGLIVNTNVLPPRVLRRRWRATFYQATKRPGDFQDKSKSLFGIAAFVNQYSPKAASTYREIASNVLKG
jgi:retron-type reverse transcriptase